MNDNIANMNSVVMSKKDLLTILENNKKEHDEVVKAALEGYWDTAKEKLQEKMDKFTSSVAELIKDGASQFDRLKEKLNDKQALSNSETIRLRFDLVQPLGIVVPENHSEDYEKAIRKINLSVYETVELSEHDVEKYVFNNWDWKESFLISNSRYVEVANIKSGEYASATNTLAKLRRG